MTESCGHDELNSPASSTHHSDVTQSNRERVNAILSSLVRVNDMLRSSPQVMTQVMTHGAHSPLHVLSYDDTASDYTPSPRVHTSLDLSPDRLQSYDRAGQMSGSVEGGSDLEEDWLDDAPTVERDNEVYNQ